MGERGTAMEQPRGVSWALLTTTQAYMATQKRKHGSSEQTSQTAGLQQMWPQTLLASVRLMVIWFPPQSTPEISPEGPSTYDGLLKISKSS